MRSSSIKSLVITAAAVVAFTLTTVPATARPAQSTQPVASAPQVREKVFATLKRLYDRFRGTLVHDGLSIPLPSPAPSSTTSSTPTFSAD